MGDNDFFSALKPKNAFIMGVVAGFLVLCAVGFFVLLAKGSGNGSLLGAKNNNKAAIQNAGADGDSGVVAAPTGNQPSQPVNIVWGIGDHVFGKQDAKIALIEYSDLQCPFCGQFHPVVKQALNEYGDKIAFIYRHFPLDNRHPQARSAAEASECVAEQKGNEGFWQFIDQIFSRQTEIGTALYEELADDIGLNMNKFKDCVDSRKYQDKVEADLQSGAGYGVQGTPGSFINGIAINGYVPYATLKAKIEQALNQ